MADDRVRGDIRGGVGHVQSGMGTLTGDERVHVRGKLNEKSCSAQNALGKPKNWSRKHRCKASRWSPR